MIRHFIYLIFPICLASNDLVGQSLEERMDAMVCFIEDSNGHSFILKQTNIIYENDPIIDEFTYTFKKNKIKVIGSSLEIYRNTSMSLIIDHDFNRVLLFKNIKGNVDILSDLQQNKWENVKYEKVDSKDVYKLSSEDLYNRYQHIISFDDGSKVFNSYNIVVHNLDDRSQMSTYTTSITDLKEVNVSDSYFSIDEIFDLEKEEILSEKISDYQLIKT